MRGAARIVGPQILAGRLMGWEWIRDVSLLILECRSAPVQRGERSKLAMGLSGLFWWEQT